MDAVALGLFSAADAAERGLEELQARGFRREQLGVVAYHRGEAERLAREAGRGEAAEADDRGQAAAAVAGGVTGFIGGISGVIFPGTGPLVAAGPVAEALTRLLGGTLGASAGGLTNALIGLGVPADQADAYAERLRDGGVLITVHTQPDQVAEAQAILAHMGAELSPKRRPPGQD